jgi:hypothetical protein
MTEHHKPYRPGNAREGWDFDDAWCARCQQDAGFRDGDGGCHVLADTIIFNVDEPGYPTEWRYGENGKPECTAFALKGHPHD